MNTKHRKIVISSVIAVFIFIFLSVTVWAASTKNILMEFEGQLEQNNPTSNIMRQIAWKMATGLHWLVKGLEDVIYNINSTLGGFFISEQIQELQNKIMILALALIVLLILFIGIMNMIKPQQVTTIISNLIIGVVIAISLPTLLSTAYNFSNQAITYINSDSTGELKKVSDRILLDNVTDVTRYEAEKFRSTTLKYKNSFVMPGGKANRITNIDPTELINPNDMKSEVWEHKLEDRNGKQVVEEIHSGFFSIPLLSTYYYRWKIDWFTIFSTLLITGMALVFSGVKIARLLYELAIHQILTQIVALFDVMTAQRLKKCLQTLVATFATLIAVFFMLQMFIIGMVYISNVTNVFLRLLLMVALAWSVIDGPDLFAQIMGVDAGINGALRTVYGLKAAGGVMTGAMAFMGGRTLLDTMKTNGAIGTAKSVVSKAGGIVGGVARHSGNIAGGVAGAVAGAVSASKETAQRMNNLKASPAQVTRNTSSQGSENKSGESIRSAADYTAPTTTSTRATNHRASSPAKTPHTTIQAPSSTDNQQAKSSSASAAIEKPSGESTIVDSPDKPNTGKQDTAPLSTIGEHIGATVITKAQQIGTIMQKSSPSVTARRAYSLTRGSFEKHGNKRVLQEEKTQQIIKSQPNIARRDAQKLAKKEIRMEKQTSSNSQSWVDQERTLERSQELRDREELN